MESFKFYNKGVSESEKAKIEIDDALETFTMYNEETILRNINNSSVRFKLF
jgi:hypothetical protein